jgi:hypothetical protein
MVKRRGNRIRRLVVREISPGAGAAVMAIGIFGLAALPRVGLLGSFLTTPLALLLLGLWSFLALMFSRALWTGALRLRARPVLERFALGTWVAGSVVTAKLLSLALPTWSALSRALEACALLVFAWYAAVIARSLPVLVTDPGGLRVSGTVLLTTVSAQAIALAAPDLFLFLPRWLVAGIIGCGAATYVLGFGLIVERYRRQRRLQLAVDWDNTNCILHGAMSITGLAAVSTGAAPWAVCLAIWLYAGLAFVVVEVIEVARLVMRVKTYGWAQGVLVYDTTQWARNFTFGMFYAFSFAFVERFGPSAGWLGAIQRSILDYGQYVVAALLVIEIILFLEAERRMGNQRHA